MAPEDKCFYNTDNELLNDKQNMIKLCNQRQRSKVQRKKRRKKKGKKTFLNNFAYLSFTEEVQYYQ